MGDTHIAEVVGGFLGRCEQLLADMVRQFPIGLLGYFAVVASEATLDVGQVRVKFAGRERTREDRVRIALDDHDLRLLRSEGVFDAGEHLSGLLVPPYGATSSSCSGIGSSSFSKKMSSSFSEWCWPGWIVGYETPRCSHSLISGEN